MDQGYSVHIINDMVDPTTPGLKFETSREQEELLSKILEMKQTVRYSHQHHPQP